jgi:hypothetical protein
VPKSTKIGWIVFGTVLLHEDDVISFFRQQIKEAHGQFTFSDIKFIFQIWAYLP